MADNLSALNSEQLAANYIKTRDTAARDLLVEKNLRLAAIVASRFSGRGVEYDDLYQVASLSLFKAVERYDPARGVKFSTFITPTMVGEVKNYFRDKARAIRLPRNAGETLKLLDNAIARLSQELSRSPTAEELANNMGVSLENVLEALEMRGAAHPMSLDSAYDEGDGETSLSAYVGFEESGYRDYENSDMITRAMARLDDKMRDVVKLRFFKGLSQRDAAARLGISQMSVSRAERRALEIMRSALEDDD